jgi:sulfoxide reductase heme-binding subunit YedZ
MWMYFFKRLHPLALQNTQFGLANFSGLAVAQLFFVLLVISNDLSLRTLGTRRWKFIQRWIYAAFSLTVVHGIAYQLVEKRRLPWVIIFVALTTAVVLIQFSGAMVIWRKRSKQDADRIVRAYVASRKGSPD